MTSATMKKDDWAALESLIAHRLGIEIAPVEERFAVYICQGCFYYSGGAMPETERQNLYPPEGTCCEVCQANIENDINYHIIQEEMWTKFKTKVGVIT